MGLAQRTAQNAKAKQVKAPSYYTYPDIHI